jgi:hypothetical protein
MQGRMTAAICAATMLATVPAITPAFAEAVAPGVLSLNPVTPGIDQIGKEMTVQNWILCTSQANAESIAKARADGVEPALKLYGDLLRTKACGVFASMKVILRQSLYESPAAVKQATRVYRASVNFGTEWPTGFVISGVLSE